MQVSNPYITRCIELARLGQGNVSPNPMVGCVIVFNDEIIGEGWHQQYGQAHAEVNAIASVKDKSVLAQSTVYVNLEPCSHFGKTPPCADLLIQHKIKKVVVGMVDPFAKVAGSGIKKLLDAGIEVEVGVMQQECEALNKRFITFHQHQRPYIILKWAQTADGFLAPDKELLSKEAFDKQKQLTGNIVQTLVHKWRTQEDAILVGTNTVLTDNPQLTARAVVGKNPLRIIIDKNNQLPRTLFVFDGAQPTLVFTNEQIESAIPNIAFATINFNENIWPQIMDELYKRNIQSVIIEGGAFTLNSIINIGLWDEAQVFTTSQNMVNGIKAPTLAGHLVSHTIIDGTSLNSYYNV